MITFLDKKELNTSPKTDIKRDNVNLSYREKLADKVSKDLEAGIELLNLSDELESLFFGIEEYSKKLPIYINAYEIVINDLEKVGQYQAGIEDYLDMTSVKNDVLTVTKILNIDVEEIGYGLLDDDPDDEENTNIIIRIIKKIFNFIVGLIVGFVKFIGKIIKVFFRFIKRILGFKDPAAKVKEKLEEEKEEHVSFSGSSSYSVPSAPSFSSSPVSVTNTRIRNTNNNNNNNSGSNNSVDTNNSSNGNNGGDKDNSNSGTVQDVINETIDNNKNAKETIENLNNATRVEENVVKKGTTKSMEKEEALNKLKGIADKVERDYPLAVLLTNIIFDYEPGKLDLFDVLTVLYILTIANVKTNIDCNTEDGIEKNVKYIIENVHELNDILADFKKAYRTKGVDELYRDRTEIQNNYFSSLGYVSLMSMIEKVYPIFNKSGKGNPEDKRKSILGTIYRIIDNFDKNLITTDANFKDLLHRVSEKTSNNVNKKINIDVLIKEVLKDKLGNSLYECTKDYMNKNLVDIPTEYENMFKTKILDKSYKYFKLYVLMFNKKDIKLMAHLTNIDNFLKLSSLNIPEPGYHLEGAEGSSEIVKTYRNFFKKELPKIAEDLKGELVPIEIEVTKEDLYKYSDVFKAKEITSSVIEVNIDKMAKIKLLNNLSKILELDVKPLEKCMNSTEHNLKKLSKEIKNIEDDFNDFIDWLTKQKAYASGIRKTYDPLYKDAKQRGLNPTDNYQNVVNEKIKTVGAVKTTVIAVAKALQETANNLVSIYKSEVIESLKEVKELISDNTISKYLSEYIDLYENLDSIS